MHCVRQLIANSSIRNKLYSWIRKRHKIDAIQMPQTLAGSRFGDIFDAGKHMTSQLEKGEQFTAMHQRSGAFIIPNPWDSGSARLLEGLGFEALATTSSGFAQTLGRLDGTVSRDEKMEHCRALASVTRIPVSADLENGFADDPDGVAATLRLAAEAGVVGASIEDFSGERIYDFDHAVERIHACVEAVRSFDCPFTLTARAENLLRGRDDLDDTVRRLEAFATAGADVVYAPGLKSMSDVRVVTAAVDKPVNVLATMLPGVTLAELDEAGVKRVSIGGALANAVIGTVLQAGREMLTAGSFGWQSGMASRADIDSLLSN